jgi:hypothetical protein
MNPPYAYTSIPQSSSTPSGYYSDMGERPSYTGAGRLSELMSSLSHHDSGGLRHSEVAKTLAKEIAGKIMTPRQTLDDPMWKADPNIAALVMGDQTTMINDTVEDVSKLTQGVTYHCKEDLLGWMRDCWPCGRALDQAILQSSLASGFVIVVLFTIYGLGISMFLLQLQFIGECEADLVILGNVNAKLGTQEQVNVEEAKKKMGTLLCKGLAEQCRLDGTFVNLKQYIQYRVAAYILLLVPFLYIPFMVITFTDSALRKITHQIKGLRIDDESDAYLERQLEKSKKKMNASRPLIRDEESNMDMDRRLGNYGAGDIKTVIGDLVLSMDKDQHSLVLNVLFFLFHGVMGGVSLYYDGTLFITMRGEPSEGPCHQYEDRAVLGKGNPPEKLLRLETLSGYQLIMGSILAFVMLCYLFLACMRLCFSAHHKRWDIAHTKIKRKMDRSAILKKTGGKLYDELQRTRDIAAQAAETERYGGTQWDTR